MGLPTKEYILAQPKRSCLVIDDSFDSALESSVIDHLFRVMSGKLSISVILMSQNLFAKGKFGRDIRNSSNFLALFRNCADSRLNLNVARMAGLAKAFEAARIDQDGEMFPVVFLDLSQKGQLSPYRLYTRLFGRYQIAYSEAGMKGYIINENDFESYFKVDLGIGKTFEAEKYEDPPSKIKGETGTEINKSNEEERTESAEKSSDKSRSNDKKSKARTFKSRYNVKQNNGFLERWKKRSEFNLSKYKKHTKLFRKNK